jgi:acyl dehydratase
MEGNPVHWDEAVAAASKYGELVAPPLWPTNAFVRAPGDPDPFDVLAENPDWDGSPKNSTGLPALPLPLKRILNGGTEAQFYKLAAVGDVISAQSRYADITEREGRSGPMVIVKMQTTFRNQDGDVLAVITNSLIRR